MIIPLTQKQPPKYYCESYHQDMIWLKALQERVGQGKKAVQHADKVLNDYLVANKKDPAPTNKFLTP